MLPVAFCFPLFYEEGNEAYGGHKEGEHKRKEGGKMNFPKPKTHSNNKPGDATKGWPSLGNSLGVSDQSQEFGGGGRSGANKGFQPLHNGHVEHRNPDEHSDPKTTIVRWFIRP